MSFCNETISTMGLFSTAEPRAENKPVNEHVELWRAMSRLVERYRADDVPLWFGCVPTNHDAQALRFCVGLAVVLWKRANLRRGFCLPAPLRPLPPVAFDPNALYPTTQRTAFQHLAEWWKTAPQALRRQARPISICMLLDANMSRASIRIRLSDSVTAPPFLNVFEWALVEHEFDLLLALWALYRHNICVMAIVNHALSPHPPTLPHFNDARFEFSSGEPVPAEKDVFKTLLLGSSKVVARNTVRLLAYFCFFLATKPNLVSPPFGALVDFIFDSFTRAMPATVLDAVVRFQVPTARSGAVVRSSTVPTSPSSLARRGDCSFNLVRALFGAHKIQHLRMLEATFARNGVPDRFSAIARDALTHVSPLTMFDSADFALTMSLFDSLHFFLRFAGDHLHIADVDAARFAIYNLLRRGTALELVQMLLHRYPQNVRQEILRSNEIQMAAQDGRFPDPAAREYILTVDADKTTAKETMDTSITEKSLSVKRRRFARHGSDDVRAAVIISDLSP